MLGVTMGRENIAEQGQEVVQVGRFIIFITALSVCLVLFHCLKLLVNLPEEGAVLDAPGSTGACSATEGGNAQQGHPQRKSKAPQ